MISHLTLNDTSPTIGESHLVILNPVPSSKIDLHAAFSELLCNQNNLFIYVNALEQRLKTLESRSWWSMLKDQIKSQIKFWFH